MSLRLLLIFLVLTSACRFSKNSDKKQVEIFADLPIDTQLHDFKNYPHLESLKIVDYVTSIESGQAVLSNPSIFLYQDENNKIRIAMEKNAKWQTWEVFNASDHNYQADIEFKNFDNKGTKELIITSFYGSSPQSTMGNEYYGDTEIWDLDKVHLYFKIEHLAYSDDMGRNGDNTYSQECKLDIQIQTLSVTILKDKELKDKESTALEENTACFEGEAYPKYFRLVDNEVVESDGITIKEQ